MTLHDVHARCLSIDDQCCECSDTIVWPGRGARAGHNSSNLFVTTAHTFISDQADQMLHEPGGHPVPQITPTLCYRTAWSH